MLDHTSLATNQPDLENIRWELEESCQRFINLCNSFTPSDWNRKGKTSAWSVKELVAHLTWAVEHLPAEIQAARQGRGMFNVPGWLANPFSVYITRIYTWQNSLNRLQERYRKAIDETLVLLTYISPEEWQKGANFYGEGFYSVLDLCHTPGEHLAEHRETIQQILKAPEIKSDNRFMLDGYLTFHKALRNNIAALCDRMGKYQVITPGNLKKLEKWFDLYCYLLTGHHNGEDEVDFVDYARRDPIFKIQMEVLAADHHQINELVTGVKAGFAELLASKDIENSKNYRQLTGLVRSLAVAVNEHLDREEAAVIKSVRTHFSEGEQKEREKQFLKREGLKHLSVSGPWIVENLNPVDRAELFRTSSIFLRVLYELSWKRKYRRIMPTFED